jgi:hypothetical protein
VETTPLTLAPDGGKRFSMPTRGVVVGLIAVGIAISAARFGGGSVSWGDVAILASLAVTALVGASEARRLVAAREHPVAPVERTEGAWMKVVIGASGPADTAGAVVVPKAPPRNDPERRSLVRRAEERKHAGASRR